jgi:molecular chaperone DnaK (HSP70)
VAEEKIGIKLADGRFYPILNSDEPKKRRAILTTASNDQERAQIDLYRSHEESMENAVYVGSVILDDLAPAGEEREIELIVGVDGEGILSARATESVSGNYQSLSVSLEAIPAEDRLELPDFDEEFEDEELDLDTDLIDKELDEEFGGELELGGDELGVEGTVPSPEESTTEEDLFGEEAEEVKKPPRRFSPVVLLVFLLLSLAALAALTYGIFKLLESDPVPTLRAVMPVLAIFTKPRSCAD